MSRKATEILRAMMLCAALLTMWLTALPAIAGDDSDEYTTPVSIAVVGEPGHPLDVETR